MKKLFFILFAAFAVTLSSCGFFAQNEPIVISRDEIDAVRDTLFQKHPGARVLMLDDDQLRDHVIIAVIEQDCSHLEHYHYYLNGGLKLIDSVDITYYKKK